METFFPEGVNAEATARGTVVNHEHPHLLSTQVAFTVTGPRRKLDEFAEDLRREEILTVRAQSEVMLSPL